MATMVTIAELRSEAVNLGLTGDAVLDFIYKQQEYYRDERAAQRSAMEAERLDAERRREHEIRVMELRTASGADQAISDAILRPKLPVYKDGEDITSYLVRFERIAELLGLQRSTYAVRLGSLLSGRAVNIYAALTPEITGNYSLLKKALLDGFNKTHETYREQFRTARLGPNETYQQFSVQLGRSLDFWLESREVQKDFVSLRNFMIVDQLLSSFSPPLRTFIKEQDAHNITDVVRIADNWTAAHKAYPNQSCPPRNNMGDQPKCTNRYNDSRPNTQRSGPSNVGGRRDNRGVKCYACGELGHVRSKCPQNPQAYPRQVPNVRTINFCLDDVNPRQYLTCGSVNGTPVSTILRDSGCNSVIVSEKVLPDTDVSSCRKTTVYDYLGRGNEFPIVKCYIRCPYFCGWIDAIRAPISFCSVLIGNVPGALNLPNLDVQDLETKPSVMSVTTRSSAKTKTIHPLVLPDFNPIDFTHDEFKTLQRNCTSLDKCRSLAASDTEIVMRDGATFKFVVEKELLYRICIKAQSSRLEGKVALVVPLDCRQTVLSMAHESPLAGHFSHRKTELRLRENLFWPSVSMDIRNYCRSCDKCQRLSQAGRVKNVPLTPIPIVTEPFNKVAIDIVGPLRPCSTEGHRYILTLIDMATGFPEAVALKQIDSISVAEALLFIFSRVGIPREILSDRGAQFTSQLMGELHRLLGVKPLFTTPYHPMGNGRIERLHSTLKACLRKLCEDKPRDWPRYLTPTLFALREIPSDRSGFSAFELLYGRQVRGPLTVLRDLWEDGNLVDEERSSFQYVMELQDKLQECAKIAAQNSEVSMNKYKTYFDLKSQNRQFSPGNEVLVLLPDVHNKLLMAWKGPFKVLERRNRVNYLIEEEGKPKLYHANLLKRYYRRTSINLAYVPDATDELSLLPSNPFCVCQSALIEEPCSNSGELDASRIAPIVTLELDETEVPEISSELDQDCSSAIKQLLRTYKSILTPIPGCTETLDYDIELQTTTSIKSKFYPVPVHLKHHFDKEVDKLLELNIIQPSSSPFSSPVVMVRKSDNSYRLTVDYRNLNAATVFYAEPPCLVEENLHKFANAKFFSELDLSKAYYQIKLTLRAQPLTAFPTSRGLMEFVRLPFGLVNACSKYAHLMRIVLHGLPNVSFYFDNIFVYADTWDEHLQALNKVFERLSIHGLTARPSKCRFGFAKINYLGFIVGEGELSLQEDKVKSIVNASPPTTKKLLRSFLGLVSFYRKFIPDAASIIAPLTDMLKKDVKEPLQWPESTSKNFNIVKTILSSKPVLKLPDCSLTFVLRTDASNSGLGAVLLQSYGDTPHPVAYASRKLLDREQRYSTIERECLAIVWGIAKFKFYLVGTRFMLEVDHKPLVYLNKFRGDNSRLMRWALSLQAYRFQIVHISGRDNVGADYLSRA